MPHQVSLLFAVEDPRADVAPSIASLVRQLNEERDWSYGEIACVNEIDEASVTQPGDEPIWTLGGALTSTRPTEDVLSERAQLEDVEALVERLCLLSSDGPAFVVEYDGEEIGLIADGRADTSLRDGLLGEWRKPPHEQ
jgi:hypothetical protein